MKKEIVGYILDYEKDRDPEFIEYPIYKRNIVHKKGDVIRPNIYINGKLMCNLIIQK